MGWMASSSSGLSSKRAARFAGANFVVLACLLAAGPAEAGLTVSPLRIVLPSKPKQTHSGIFEVQNTGSATLKVLVEPVDWTGGVSGDRAKVDWMTVHPSEFSLTPGQRAQVEYRVRVPKKAKGELRAQVFFSMMSDGASGAVDVTSRLGAVVYVPIKGSEEIDFEITKIDAAYSASTPGVAQPDRLDVAIRIRNHSNIHIIPGGDLLIHDTRGRVVARVPIAKGWGLLPHEGDTYRVVAPGLHLKPGRYTLGAVIRCGEDVGHESVVERAVGLKIAEDGSLQLSSPLP